MGRHPEFARMSNRPGIGASAMAIIGESLFNKYMVHEIHKTGDVPRTVKHGKKSYPLGRYLRQKLRDHVGMPDEYLELNHFIYSAQMSALLQDAFANPEKKPLSLWHLLKEENAQKAVQIETRYKIFQKAKTL